MCRLSPVDSLKINIADACHYKAKGFIVVKIPVTEKIERFIDFITKSFTCRITGIPGGWGGIVIG